LAFRPRNEIGDSDCFALGSFLIIHSADRLSDLQLSSINRLTIRAHPVPANASTTDCRKTQYRSQRATNPHGLRKPQSDASLARQISESECVPHGDQVLGVLKDLPLGRAPGSRFLLRGLAAPVLHFALVEAHPYQFIFPPTLPI
jgi:hypothetical protein